MEGRRKRKRENGNEETHPPVRETHVIQPQHRGIHVDGVHTHTHTFIAIEVSIKWTLFPSTNSPANPGLTPLPLDFIAAAGSGGIREVKVHHPLSPRFLAPKSTVSQMYNTRCKTQDLKHEHETQDVRYKM